jgi:hypothetical protein
MLREDWPKPDEIEAKTPPPGYLQSEAFADFDKFAFEEADEPIVVDR